MMKRITGFTLVELMVTLIVAAILLTIGVPSFLETIRRSRTISQANELVTALNLARSEAVKRGMQVTLLQTGAEWEDGWQVFVDENADHVLDTGETMLQEYSALSEGYTLRTGGNISDWVAYLPSGLSDMEGGLNRDTFRLCTDEQDNATGRSIVLNVVGRAMVQEGTNSCP
jgi:type IV fimbrial biogenesis protein FimT